MSKEYNISKPPDSCAACQKQCPPGEELVATVKEVNEDLQRQDFCLACWEANGRSADPEILAQWHWHVPRKEEKKKLLVDDELLINFFQRLEGSLEPTRVSFRFVLALILMRKRLLIYDRSRKEADGREIWSIRLKGSDQAMEVVDPHLDEQKIADVSQRLGEIMQGDL